MERLTQKDDFFDYVLPEQNIFGDNQAFEISLGKTEYTCKLYITGEAIKRFGELEDVLEKYGIDNLDEFIKEYSSRNIKLANDNYALEQELAELKGENFDINFGSQISSYVFHPYKMVKDLRTGHETSDTQAVLDGDLNDFMKEYLMGGGKE